MQNRKAGEGRKKGGRVVEEVVIKSAKGRKKSEEL